MLEIISFCVCAYKISARLEHRRKTLCKWIRVQQKIVIDCWDHPKHITLPSVISFKCFKPSTFRPAGARPGCRSGRGGTCRQHRTSTRRSCGPIHLDIMDYIRPALCTDETFRAMWAEFER